MPQFLVEPSRIKNNTAVVRGGDARHINAVLRLKAGDWLVITDGMGHRWRSEVISSSPAKVEVKLISLLTTDDQQPTTVVLAQALLKHDRFEDIIQRTIELGCQKIIPFISKRTVCQRTGEQAHKRIRWQKIADEAAKQCGTAIRPVVEPPTTFEQLLNHFERFQQVLLFWEGETSLHLNTQTLKHSNTLLITGPEGGFAAEEVGLAREAGAVTASLGPLILRAGTAAIAALALMQYKLGYFDKTAI